MLEGMSKDFKRERKKERLHNNGKDEHSGSYTNWRERQTEIEENQIESQRGRERERERKRSKERGEGGCGDKKKE